MKNTLSLAVLLAAVMLTGCATGYGPKGMTGGYEDQQIDESTYRVSFHGNGHTDGNKVWNYWMYRCAELTKLKGFEFFSLIVEKKKTGALPGDDSLRPANLRDGEEGRLVNVAGYYYTPGSTYTITTYHSSAVVKMYRNPLPADVKFALKAQSVLDSLKPYVESSGKEPAPKREEIIVKAMVKTAS